MLLYVTVSVLALCNSSIESFVRIRRAMYKNATPHSYTFDIHTKAKVICTQQLSWILKMLKYEHQKRSNVFHWPVFQLVSGITEFKTHHVFYNVPFCKVRYDNLVLFSITKKYFFCKVLLFQLPTIVQHILNILSVISHFF